MPTTILKAHYDGKHIVLDEPFDLTPGATLAVAILSTADPELKSERTEWFALNAQSLARAYGEDEPDYGVTDLRK